MKYQNHKLSSAWIVLTSKCYLLATEKYIVVEGRNGKNIIQVLHHAYLGLTELEDKVFDKKKTKSKK